MNMKFRYLILSMGIDYQNGSQPPQVLYARQHSGFSLSTFTCNKIRNTTGCNSYGSVRVHSRLSPPFAAEHDGTIIQCGSGLVGRRSKSGDQGTTVPRARPPVTRHEHPTPT